MNTYTPVPSYSHLWSFNACHWPWPSYRMTANDLPIISHQWPWPHYRMTANDLPIILHLWPWPNYIINDLDLNTAWHNPHESDFWLISHSIIIHGWSIRIESSTLYSSRFTKKLSTTGSKVRNKFQTQQLQCLVEHISKYYLNPFASGVHI